MGFVVILFITAIFLALLLLHRNRRFRRRGWRGRLARRDQGRLGALTVGRRLRHYLFYRPSSADDGAPLPLVMAFHGGFGNPITFANRSGLNEAANRHGFAVVYPAAAGHWSDGRGHNGLGAADTAFVRQLYDHLRQSEAIDGRRIYALGASNGGMFVHRLALEMPQLFAAYAAVMAALPTGLAHAAQSGRPVPLMLVNAVDDDMIPWCGGTVAHGRGVGGTVIGVEDTVGFWQRRNRCRAPRLSRYWRVLMAGGEAAELYEYPAESDGAALSFLKLLHGGHQWPHTALITSTAADGAKVETTVADLIWDFLSRHAQSGLPGRMPIEPRHTGRPPHEAARHP